MASPPADGKNSPEGEAIGARGTAGTTDLGDGPNVENGPSDRELIDSVRQGSTDAYAQLYERHVNAAYSMARQVAKSPGEADDLVSEAFVRVLDTMRAGNGPNTAFRAYLLTSLRNTAYDRSRRERKIQLSEDVDEIGAPELSLPFSDPALAGLERSMVATAFSRLPERWQAVLWHVEIEGEAPGQVASVFGLTANGVSALAYRAREGLRQEYLQAHLGELGEDGGERCRATVDRLGAWARGGLSKRENAQVDAHLDGCQRCRALAAELSDVNGGLRAVIAPAVLGLGAMGYLSTQAQAVVGASAGAAGGVAAGADAASSVPRQTVGMAASGTALAATVALAIALTGNEQAPVAAPPPPPPAPAPAAPDPPAPDPPSSPARKPAPAPAPAPALPGSPNVTASGPQQPVELVAGGSPSDLPITVRNEGEGVSQPVTVTLSLPRGVTAELADAGSGGPGSAGPRSAQSQAAQSRAAQHQAAQSQAAQPRAATTAPASTTSASTTPASTGPAATTPAAATPAGAQPGSPASSSRTGGSAQGTTCERFDGGIRCSSASGLAPGEAHTFPFRLHADETAQDGQVSAHVAAGQRVDFSLAAVPVVVRPPEDGVRVEASGWGSFPWLHSRLALEVRNTGAVSGRAQAVVKLPPGVHALGLPPECAVLPNRDHELRCSAKLAPGQKFEGAVWLKAVPHGGSSEGASGNASEDDESTGARPTSPWRTVTIPVVATLDSAVDEDTAELHRLGGPRLPRPWNPPHLPEKHPGEGPSSPERPSSDLPSSERPGPAWLPNVPSANPDPQEDPGAPEEEESDDDVGGTAPMSDCLSELAELPLQQRAERLVTGCHPVR